jgi:hypothetical protein
VLATPVVMEVLAVEEAVATLIVLVAQETLHLQAQVKVIMVDQATLLPPDAVEAVAVQVLSVQTQTVLMEVLAVQEQRLP